LIALLCNDAAAAAAADDDDDDVHVGLCARRIVKHITKSKPM